LPSLRQRIIILIMDDFSRIAGRKAANIITKALLGSLGLENSYDHLLNENKEHISSEVNTSESLIQIEELANKVLQKRKSLKENIAAIEANISSLETEFFKKQEGVFNRLFTKKETIENLGNEIDNNRTLLNNLKAELEECKLNVDDLADPTHQDKYAEVISAFKELSYSNKIWDIVTRANSTEQKSSASSIVDRIEVNFSTETLDFIVCKYSALHFENANGSNIYLYPTFVLLKNKQEQIKLIDLKELNFSSRQQRFIEPKISLPSDAEIIDYAWAKVNKDGSPDMRFKGNYQTPVAKYSAISLSTSNGLDELYYVSNYQQAEKFSTSFDDFLSLLKGKTINEPNNKNVTEKEFNIIKEFADKFIKFITRLQSDTTFCDFVTNNESIKRLGFGNGEDTIRNLLIVDVAKCFNQFASISDTHTKEFFALLYLHSKILRPSFEIQYSIIPQLYENVVPTLLPFFETIKGETQQKDIESHSFFKISTLLGGYDKDLKTEYLTNLYQFSSIVVKADGVVTKNEEDILKRILLLKETSTERKQQSTQEKKSSPKLTKQNIDEILEELNGLTGLEGVKKEINTLINFIKVQKAREESGLKSSSISYHIVFTGNPGTGKTTVARIVAKIYKSLGVLNEGQLIETDRSGLIAEYVGQTAIKVNKTVDSALNGVLFIDEAYSIAGESDNDFGKEAVATLIKRMEDDRDKLIVIIAGYTNEMNEFIETNPGFKSRFNRYIEFKDYTPTELLSIYESLCTKLDYKLTDNAKTKLTSLLDKSYNGRDHSFGNGRFVRNIFEKSLEIQANRIASVAVLDKETLTTITENDIP
jgi:AAA+ superfamily predicted ATPase